MRTSNCLDSVGTQSAGLYLRIGKSPDKSGALTTLRGPRVYRQAMGWRRGRTAAAVAALAVAAGAGAPADRAGAATVPGSNTVTFFHDRWHPERTIVLSSNVITRNPPPLAVSISVAPASRTAAVRAVLKNDSDNTIFFTRSGVSVDATVVRNGRGLTTWTLRDPDLRSLAPGQSSAIDAVFELPMPGNYLVSATARY